MSVTDADREKARLVVGVWKHTGDDLADIIAAQLAEEREKARAPFILLAERWAVDPDSDDRDREAAEAIIRAAEESQ